MHCVVPALCADAGAHYDSASTWGPTYIKCTKLSPGPILRRHLRHRHFIWVVIQSLVGRDPVGAWGLHTGGAPQVNAPCSRPLQSCGPPDAPTACVGPPHGTCTKVSCCDMQNRDRRAWRCCLATRCTLAGTLPCFSQCATCAHLSLLILWLPRGEEVVGAGHPELFARWLGGWRSDCGHSKVGTA
jgi:hypothetical protein